MQVMTRITFKSNTFTILQPIFEDIAEMMGNTQHRFPSITQLPGSHYKTPTGRIYYEYAGVATSSHLGVTVHHHKIGTIVDSDIATLISLKYSKHIRHSKRYVLRRKMPTRYTHHFDEAL